MSKYKSGDKVVIEVKDVYLSAYGIKCYGLNGIGDYGAEKIDERTEPLTTYTEPLEDTIQKYTVKIARLVMEKERLKDENERLKAENEKMSIKIDAYELCSDPHEVEYNQAFNQGAEAAWELARKIILPPSKGGMSSDDYIAIFGNCISESYVMKNYTYSEAAAKVAEWEKAKEEIKVGDVFQDDDGNNAIVTSIKGNTIYYMWDDGDTRSGFAEDVKKHFTKTGRHIDIDDFLKQIGGEQE